MTSAGRKNIEDLQDPLPKVWAADSHLLKAKQLCIIRVGRDPLCFFVWRRDDFMNESPERGNMARPSLSRCHDGPFVFSCSGDYSVLSACAWPVLGLLVFVAVLPALIWRLLEEEKFLARTWRGMWNTSFRFAGGRYPKFFDLMRSGFDCSIRRRVEASDQA